jgi:hypothetical protein
VKRRPAAAENHDAGTPRSTRDGRWASSDAAPIGRRASPEITDSFVPILVFIVFFVDFIDVDLVVVRDDLIVFILIVVVIVVRRHFELDRRQTGDLQIRAAFRTTQLITFIDIEFVDFDVGVAFGAGGHL